ncbi:MAG: transposase, partial [Phycicoccus sp.]
NLAYRWVRESGGMIRVRTARSGYRLTFEDREQIEELLARGHTQAEVARELGRPASTICRELARNGRRWRAADGRWRTERPYCASVAQLKAEERARRPKPTKLSGHRVLAATVQGWIGAHTRMSPQQVSHRLVQMFPDDESMRVSHETIYTELYVQGRGSVRADLHKALRTGRARRAPRKAARRPRVPGELLMRTGPRTSTDAPCPGTGRAT